MRPQLKPHRRLRAVAVLVGGVLLLAFAAPTLAQDRPDQRAGTSSFDEFVDAWSEDEPPAATTAPTRDTAPPARQVAPLSEAVGNSTLAGAAPILLALLGVAIVLLGIAALPPSAARRSSVGVLVAERRLEIGLIGAAVLASAAVGLLVAVLSA